jgi:hypothetical protein
MPLPAITLFGFRFEDHYSTIAADELQDGISAGETNLRQAAMHQGLSLAAYRRYLAGRFREVADPHRRTNFAEPEARSNK